MSNEVDVEQAQYDGTLAAERGPIVPVLRYEGGADEPWEIVSGNEVLGRYATKGEAERDLAEILDDVALFTEDRARAAHDATYGDDLTGAATPDEIEVDPDGTEAEVTGDGTGEELPPIEGDQTEE